MRTVARHGLALAVVTILVAGGCSKSDGGSTATAAGGPSSSPATTVTVAPSVTIAPTTAPPTTTPTGPAVAEAGGWLIVITAPTALATIGPALDLCYEVTGPTQGADIAFDVSLVIAATGTLFSKARVDAAVGRGSARVGLGVPDARRYDMPVQALVSGQPVPGLAVVIRGVVFGSTPPAGCP